MPGRDQDLHSAVVDKYVNSVEPPITVIDCLPGTQSLNLAERGRKKLLVLCNPNLHYGRLNLKGRKKMLFAAEGQLDHHPMPQSSDFTQHVVSRIEAHSGRRPYASA